MKPCKQNRKRDGSDSHTHYYNTCYSVKFLVSASSSGKTTGIVHQERIKVVSVVKTDSIFKRVTKILLSINVMTVTICCLLLC